jgi:hypothetical protein
MIRLGFKTGNYLIFSNMGEKNAQKESKTIAILQGIW